MSHHIPQDILLGIENISKSGTGATWSLTKTSQGLSFTGISKFIFVIPKKKWQDLNLKLLF